MTRQKTSPIGSIVRAGGEILIIVCGILLAFALDAWWGLRREATLSDQLLGDLAVEFRDVHSALDRSRLRNNQVVHAADNILVATRAANGPVNVSVADVGTLLLTPTADPLQRDLAALQASGALDLIQSDSLRDLLATWPAAFEDVREEEIAARAFVQEILIADLLDLLELKEPLRWRLEEWRQSRQPGYRPEQTSDPGNQRTVVVAPTVRFINLVETRRYLAEFVNSSREDLRRQASEISRLLEARVD